MRMLAPFLTTLLPFSLFSPALPAWAQEELRSGRFQTSDGVELHYLEAGSGPLLVFVPGWTMPASIWRAQLEHFATSHHAVALDPRGHGESEKATFGYTAERRGRDICELLTHLDEGSAVIVGWSGAGRHVLLCADEVGTDIVRAVVVVDWDIKVEADRDFAADRIASVEGDRPAFTRAFVEQIHRDPDPGYVDDLTEVVLNVPTTVAAISIANSYFFGPHDLSPIIDRLDRPVLLMFSDLGWAKEAAEEALTLWPDMPVEVIAETAHALFVDRPDAFNRTLAAFLDRIR